MFNSFASNSKLDFVGRWYDAAFGRGKWIKVEASIRSCTKCEDEEQLYFVTYRYQVNGKQYDDSYTSDEPERQGTQITVCYKPSNPKCNYLADYPGGRAPLVLIAIAAGFGVFWLILHLMSRGYY